MTTFRYVPALNGVRAAAVLAVIVAHAGMPHMKGGKAGVLVFFALSGYLITSILIKERAFTGRVSIRNFYIRRALRLFPAMVIAVCAFGVLALTQAHTALGQETLAALPSGAFYFLNWFNIANDAGVGMIGHFWSLSVEEQFYFVWPFLMLAAYKMWAVRGVLWVALTGAALSYTEKWLLVADSHRQTGTDFAADALLVGCALAAALALYPNIVGKLSRLLMWPAVAGICAAVVLGNSDSSATAVEAAEFARIWWPIASIGSCAVIGALVTGTAPRWVTTMLELKPFDYLGKISYGLYLYHILALVVLGWFLPGHGLQAMVRLALALVGTFAMAALSYELVEKRFLSMKPPHKEPTAVAVGTNRTDVEYGLVRTLLRRGQMSGKKNKKIASISGLVALLLLTVGVVAFGYFKPAPPPAPTIDMAKAEDAKKKFEADQTAQAAAILAANEPMKVPQPEGRPLSVLFAGDSITVGRDASSEATSFRGLLIDRLSKRGPVAPVRIGDSSKMTAEVLPQASALTGPADLAIVELGTNDLYKSTPEKFAKDYPAMLDAVRKSSPNAPLICVGVWQSSPVGSMLDATIDTECGARGGRFVSLKAIHQNPANKSTPGTPHFAGGLTDGAHPNDDGHAYIAEGILERLKID